MAITDPAIKNAKPRDRTYKLYDERGLYLEVAPQGGKWWRLKYRFDGKEKRISVGTYPDVSLKDAREKRDELRKQIAGGNDPSSTRREEKAARKNTFETVGFEYIASKKGAWAPRTLLLVTDRLTKDLLKHHATTTEPKEIGALLRAIEGYSGEPAVAAALQLAPHVFLRPGELRAAEWSEIDFDTCEWRVPGKRMKMGEVHIVPLSRQVVRILASLREIRDKRRLIFPSVRTAERPISENTINAALRRLGYTKERMTGNGFRSLASTRLNESQKWHRDAIERQLAHGERDKVRASYNYAEHLTERRNMMQWWSDYLDALGERGNPRLSTLTAVMKATGMRFAAAADIKTKKPASRRRATASA